MTEIQLDVPHIDPELPPSSDPFGEVLQLTQLPGVMNVEVVTSGHRWIEREGESPVFMPQGSLVLISRGNWHILRGNSDDEATWIESVREEEQGWIAERVGYQSEPAFNRAFKREVGVSPGAVRKLHRRGGDFR